jgi:hypothetical protein
MTDLCRDPMIKRKLAAPAGQRSLLHPPDDLRCSDRRAQDFRQGSFAAEPWCGMWCDESRKPRMKSNPSYSPEGAWEAGERGVKS